MTFSTRLLATSLLCLSAACAGDLDDELGGDGVEPPAEGMVGPHTNSEPRAPEGTSTVIDATSEESWVYFDLETGTEVEVADPQDDIVWDLAFRRFHIATNSGISGSAGAEVAVVELAFDDVTQVPSDGLIVDEDDGDDDNMDPDYAFAEWYDYNFMTHVLTPKTQTYVVITGAGNAFKVGLEQYYDDAGTSGVPRFAWAPL